MTGSKNFITKVSIVAAALAALAVVLLAPTSRNRAAGDAFKAEIESFQLSNGMEVVLFANHNVPAVTHMLWYRVGAADDYPGRSGLAHYNEHMMFQGTETTQSGAFLKAVSDRGGRANAFTNHDYTAYFVTIAKEHLPMVMEMEADRMLRLSPTEEKFAKEREVIIEERRSVIENQPSALLQEEMRALLYRNHPYGTPNIGWMHEMASLSRADVLAFHKEFYHPSNAVLVVTGDISKAELQPLAEKHYGSLPAGTVPRRQWNQEPPQRGPRRTQLEHPNVREAEWVRMYSAPSNNGSEEDKNTVLPGFILSQVLGGGSSSRLYQALVVRQKLATEISMSYDGFSLGPGDVVIYARPAKGVTPSQLEEAIDRELTAFRSSSISEEELERAKTLLKAETIYARDGIEGMARTLGLLIVQGLSTSYFLEWPDKVEAVSAEDVMKAAPALLNSDNSVTGILLPSDTAKKDSAP